MFIPCHPNHTMSKLITGEVTTVAKCNCNVFIVQYGSPEHQEPQEEDLSPCRTQLASGQMCLHTLHDFPQKCKDQTPGPFPGRLCG